MFTVFFKLNQNSSIFKWFECIFKLKRAKSTNYKQTLSNLSYFIFCNGKNQQNSTQKPYIKVQKYSDLFSIFDFQFNVQRVECVERHKDQVRCEPNRTPTPQIVRERKLLLLITRYFFGKSQWQEMPHLLLNQIFFSV